MMEALKCYCRLGVEENELKGHITGIEYQGNGIFICPECKEKSDLSEHIYKIIVSVEREDGYNIIKIIDGEERISKHFYDDPKYLVVKDCIEDDLNEGMYEGEWLKSHREGTFKLEVYHYPYEYMTDCGMEYDTDMFIVSERGMLKLED